MIRWQLRFWDGLWQYYIAGRGHTPPAVTEPDAMDVIVKLLFLAYQNSQQGSKKTVLLRTIPFKQITKALILFLMSLWTWKLNPKICWVCFIDVSWRSILFILEGSLTILGYLDILTWRSWYQNHSNLAVYEMLDDGPLTKLPREYLI